MLDFLLTNIDQIIEAIAYVIAGASIIVKLTPATWDDNIVSTIAKFVALNKAK